MKKYLANVVTSLRIVGSILMMFAPVFSFWFGILYLFCGVTDMIDGSIARLTHTVSKSGERLDSVADAVFMIIAFIKLLPVIQLPKLSIPAPIEPPVRSLRATLPAVQSHPSGGVNHPSGK